MCAPLFTWMATTSSQWRRWQQQILLNRYCHQCTQNGSILDFNQSLFALRAVSRNHLTYFPFSQWIARSLSFPHTHTHTVQSTPSPTDLDHKMVFYISLCHHSLGFSARLFFDIFFSSFVSLFLSLLFAIRLLHRMRNVINFNLSVRMKYISIYENGRRLRTLEKCALKAKVLLFFNHFTREQAIDVWCAHEVQWIRNEVRAAEKRKGS